mgnify:FL=1
MTLKNLSISLCAVLIGVACNTVAPADDAQQVSDPVQAAIIALEKKILADPKNAELYAERAKLNEQRDSVELAEKDWQRAIAAAPSDPRWHIGLGDLYYRKIRVDQADAQFREAIAVDATNVEARLKRSEIMLLQRKYTDAMAMANEALRLDVQNPRGYFLKGWIHMEAGDTALAISSYRTAIEQDPAQYEAYIALGLLHAAKRDPLALEYYNSAIDLKPKSVEAWYNKGMYAQENGLDSLAMDCYSHIKEIDPRNATAWYNTGYILLEHQGRYAEAREQFGKAIQLMPTYVQAYYNRGLCYEREQRLDSALIDYQRAIALAPDMTLAAEGLGRLQDKGMKVPRPQ